jgi:hypothetical protein
MAAKMKDLTGQRFGSLVAVRLAKEHNHNHTLMWVCQCECGRVVNRASTKLRNKEIRSCGCKEREREVRTAPGESGCKSLLASYKGAAKRRNLEFDVSYYEFKQLTKQSCYYCDAIPSSIQYGSMGIRKEYGAYLYNGIDRIDNNQGYIKGNMVTCCIHCNRAKHTRTHDDFVNWISQVYNHLHK